jgi:hypothetical protein
MSAKLVPTFAGRGCRVVSATDPHVVNLHFLDLGGKIYIQILRNSLKFLNQVMEKYILFFLWLFNDNFSVSKQYSV